MFLTTIVVIDVIRRYTWVAIPASFLSLSMVPFASCALVIGSISWVVPRRVYVSLDNALYTSFMRICSFVFENVANVSIYIDGDISEITRKQESAIVFSNHQSDVDWAVINMLASRQKCGEKILRFMVKYAIHYVPLFGWYIFQHGYVFVRRFGNFVLSPVEKQLSYLAELNEPFWLLIFPEGTRYSLAKHSIIIKTREQCIHKNIEPFKSLFFPYTNGFCMALSKLRNSVDAVYDITIAYERSRHNMKRIAPNMFEFVSNPKSSLYIHVRRFPIEEISSDETVLKKWLIHRFVEKEKVLNAFYEYKIEMNAMEERAVLPLSRTFAPVSIYLTLLIAPVFSKTFRRIYFFTILSSPLLILWLKIRSCV